MTLVSRASTKIGSLLQLKRAFHFVWHASRQWTLASIALVLVQGLLPLLSIYLLKLMVEAVIAGAAAPDKDAAFAHILRVLLLAGGVTVLSSGCEALSTLVSEAQSEAVSNHMNSVVHAKAIEIDLEYYENAEYHDKLHRAQQEAPYRPTRIVRGLSQLGQSAITGLAIAGLLISLHWGIIFVLAGAAVPGLLVRLKFTRETFLWKRSRTLADRQIDYFNWLLTLSHFAKEVRLFELGPYFMRRSQELRGTMQTERVALAKRRAFADVLAQGFAVVPLFACLTFIAYRALQDGKPANFVMYFTALQRGQAALQGVLGALLNLHEDNAFLANIYDFLDLKPRVAEPISPSPVPAPMQRGFHFEGVAFDYPLSGRSAIKSIDFRIRPGEVVALVGENGSGKTTLVKLLCRLYDPTCGSITLDGIDIRQFSTSDFRRQISVIFQDYVHYDLTARENIWLGNSQLAPDDDKIITAARAAGASDVIEKLPLQYENMLGVYNEGAENLSIGQWQKIALARAFLRDSQLIILDEPTSALDPQAEFEVFEKFRQLIRGQAAILISHRLSTVKMADRICVMSGGCIVEDGTHDELMAQNGIYTRLFETQANSYL